MFDWPVIWLAKMRPLKGSDLLSSQQMFVGETLERVHDIFGREAAAALEESGTLVKLHAQLVEAADETFNDMRDRPLVPDVKRPYGKNARGARADDFVNEAPSKPSLRSMI
jgi:hypothetical protein